MQRSGSGNSRGSRNGGGGGYGGGYPANGAAAMPPPGWMYPVYAYQMPMAPYPYAMPAHPYAQQPPMELPPPMLFGIDVECVATGTTHNDRSVAQFAIVVCVMPSA